jgi:hypothetical protein
MSLSLRCQRGQASVELVAVLPAIVLAGLVAWQIVLAGHAAWLCAGAARVGARAAVVGRAPAPAVRSALPAHLERGLRVEQPSPGRVRVEVRLPWVVPGRSLPLTVAATSALGTPR